MVRLESLTYVSTAWGFPNMLWPNLMLLAEEGAGGSGWGTTLMPLAIIMVLFWFLLIRPQRREQSRREEMLRGVKVNDRVMTNAGIYGIVVNVHRERNEVTLRVDDATNTRIKVALWAVAQILGDEAPSEPQK